MHPMPTIALATELERDRENERQKLQARSQALAVRRQRSHRAPWLLQALRAGTSLRPRLS